MFRILGRRVNKQPENQLRRELTVSVSQQHVPPPQVQGGQSLHPCWLRLQNLETMVTVLFDKPTNIPQEKEDILRDSLDRIKSIEHDLQKTKKVTKYTPPFSANKRNIFVSRSIYLPPGIRSN